MSKQSSERLTKYSICLIFHVSSNNLFFWESMKFIQILDFFCISIVTLSAKLNFEIVLRYAQIIDFPVYYTVQMTSKKAIVYIHITQATIGPNLNEVGLNFHTSAYIFTRFFVSFYVYPVKFSFSEKATKICTIVLMVLTFTK